MKKIISIFVIICIIFVAFSTILKAEAADNTPTVSTEVWNGITNEYVGVKFLINNLDENNSYEYAILGDNSDPTENDWKTLYFSDPDLNDVGVIKYAINDILKTKEYAYLSLRSFIYNNGQKENTIIINKEKCDLPLPDFFGRRIVISTGILGTNIYFKPMFDISNGQYQFVKIKDNNIIEKYKEYRNDKKDSTLNELKNLLPTESEVPLSGWNDFAAKEEYDIPKEYGFYYVWAKAQEGNSRSIVGLNIIEVTNNRVNSRDNETAENTLGEQNIDNKNTNANITDSTISKMSKLPNTGINIAIIISILLVTVIVLILKIKSNKYNGIK